METYSLKQVIILIITFNGFFLGSLIAAGHIIRNFKSLKTWLFLLLFLIFGLFQVHYIFFETATLDQYKIINLFPVTAFYLLGPVILLITRYSLADEYHFSKRDFFHFIPAIFISLMALIIIFLSDFRTTTLLQGYYYNKQLLVIGCSGSLMFTIYLGLAVRECIKSFIFSKSVLRENTVALAALSIIIFMALALIFDIFAMALNSLHFMELSLVTLNLVIISLFLILFKYPEYEKTIQAVVKNEQERRSYLGGVNTEELEEKIHHLITQEEIFSDEDLNLETMAEKVGVTKHQLSEFFNRNRGENFSSFIKRCRINKAKHLLIQHPDRKILAIAFDVGFKSKSTFNAAFLKFEKITPAKFRKQHQK